MLGTSITGGTIVKCSCGEMEALEHLHNAILFIEAHSQEFAHVLDAAIRMTSSHVFAKGLGNIPKD